MPLSTPTDRRPGDVLERMEQGAHRMEILTWIMAGLTLVNTAFVILAASGAL